METQMQKANIGIPRGKGGGWDKLGDGDSHIHTIDAMCKIDNE